MREKSFSMLKIIVVTNYTTKTVSYLLYRLKLNPKSYPDCAQVSWHRRMAEKADGAADGGDKPDDCEKASRRQSRQ